MTTHNLANHPFVTIVIPVLNEERFLKSLFESLGYLNGNRILPGNYEIIVVDGGSTDRTLPILDELNEHGDLKVIHNPLVIQSAGVNLAVKNANPHSKILVRIDAHAIYEEGFISQVVSSMIESKAQSVVVPLITRSQNNQSVFAEAVEIAQLSKMGNGGASHRLSSTPAQWVEHGHHAGFDIDFFREIGGYDEQFATNEDAEYDTRVIEAGGRIWFDPKAKAWYSPRESMKSLSIQYYKYGIGRASTILKHKLIPKPRQMFPVVAFIANVTAILLSLFSNLFLLVPFLYILVCYFAAFIELKSSEKANYKFIREQAAVALVIMHMSWAIGYLSQFFRKYVKSISGKNRGH